MNDEELKQYAKEKFVVNGFIIVYQWRNFIDYLQILLKKEWKTRETEILEIIDEWLEENATADSDERDYKIIAGIDEVNELKQKIKGEEK